MVEVQDHQWVLQLFKVAKPGLIIDFTFTYKGINMCIFCNKQYLIHIEQQQ